MKREEVIVPDPFVPLQDVENVAKKIREAEDALVLQESNDAALAGMEGVFLSSHSLRFQSLLKIDRVKLAAEQASDSTLKYLGGSHREGISKRNVSLQIRAGVFYRQYRDRRGVVFNQLVVPTKHGKDLLCLSHGSSWSCHLGVKKAKARLLQEFHWPGCFGLLQEFERSCDACQRVGKPNDKSQASLKLIPLITEQFRPLVIDVMGSLPVTNSGYRYLLTMLCPVTKLPEAIPLKELNSVAIVDALLSVFA